MDLGQVFTKKNVADYMVSLFTIDKEMRILEPCFGTGAFLAALERGGFKNITGYEIDEALFQNTKQRFASHNLFRENFLAIGNDLKYDGIIMNPPYVRHEKIDELKSYGITKKLLKNDNLFMTLPSTANLYMYFIIKTIELLKDNGELIVIFPCTWLESQSGVGFKNELKKKCGIEIEAYISGNIFETNALVEVLILKLRKNRFDIVKTEKKFVADEFGLHEVDFEKKCLIELGFNTSFNKIAKVRRGLSTGWNSFFINPKVLNNLNQIPILSTPKSVFGYRTKGAIYDNLFMVKEDEPLSDEGLEYIELAQKELVETKSPKALYEKYLEGSSWYKLSGIDSSGILFSYFVRNDMKFIMNDAELLARDNFYIIQSLIKSEQLLLFAILNSIYTYLQLECMGKKYGAGLLKLQRYDIANLMFPSLTEILKEDKDELTRLAEKLIESSNKLYVIEITKVLEKYSLMSANDVIKEYQNMKSVRLGDKHGKKCG